MIESKVIYPYIKITMSLFLLVAVCISCTPTIDLSGDATVESTRQTPRATTTLSAAAIQKTSTPKATPSPSLPDPTVAIATSTPTISSTEAITPTVVASATPDPIHGDLFFFSAYSPYEPRYIYSLSLETGQETEILKQEDGEDLSARFSPTGRWAIYWVEKADHSELWLTPLELWSPELVLSVPKTDYDSYRFEWLSGEHYLLFQLYDKVYGPTKPANSYLINTENKQIVTPPDWDGYCNLVAFSPRTSQIATWCPLGNEQDTAVTYAVVEENGEQWVSNEPPVQIVKEYGRDRLWSHDQQYFIFSDDADPWDWLAIMNTSTETTIRLTDEYSDHYSVYALSPNNRYLAYGGTCADGSFCDLIMDIETGEVIWTNQAVMPPGSFTTGVSWSPDSRYFIFNVPPELLILEVETGEVVMRFDDLDWIDGVWLQDK
jgi:Tol biopolymer transport system component